MRHHWLTTLVIALSTFSARAEDELTVLKAKPGETPPGKRLYETLERQTKPFFDRRREEVAKLKTSEDITARQSTLRAKFVEAIGEMPTEKTPLNAKITGKIAKDGYTVENVIYESRPSHHVTANLYRPEGAGPFPGVLVPCGHSANGKAAETYQRISILLAKNGMISLCFDPIGQGERAQILDPSGKPAVNGSTTEHTLTGIGALLVGRTAAGYRLWDAIRSLDYLASRPDVDPKRLGCTGNSGGGTETAYLMAFDDRVAVAAPSCYITSLERLFATIGPQDAEQNLNGQVALGIEHADYITMRAPKPTMLAVGTKDFFDIDGSWTTFREAKGIYGRLGFGERVELFESDETHGFTLPRRQACMRWMRRWLLDKNDAPVEADFSIATDKDLQCTETGQVISSFRETSVFDMNADRARELLAKREKTNEGRTTEALRDEIRKRLSLEKIDWESARGNSTVVFRDGYTITRGVVKTEPGVTIPVRLFRSHKAVDQGKMIVFLGADPALGAPGGRIEQHVKAGISVAMIEPRGTGETSPVPPQGGGYGRGLFGTDEREATLSFHLNRPLLGQRVFDVVQAIRAIEPLGPKAYHLIGVGICGPVALHVGALDDRVTSVEIDRSILSWTDVALTPITHAQLSSVVPGVLNSYDLNDLAAAIAPRPLTIRNPISADGKALDKTRLEAEYKNVAAAYKRAGATDQLRYEVNP